MTALDLRYGRRGGGWLDPRFHTPPDRAPLCEVCGQPMCVGQRTRHFTCSPPASCCGYPIDLIPNLDDHHEAHEQEPTPWTI